MNIDTISMGRATTISQGYIVRGDRPGGESDSGVIVTATTVTVGI